MHLIKFVVAALPALALADTSAAPTTLTTICTATTKLVKTVTLSRACTVTSTYGYNTSAAYFPTGSLKSIYTAPALTTVKGTPIPVPTTNPTRGPANAAGALDAAKIAFAGIAGMAIVAMM